MQCPKCEQSKLIRVQRSGLGDTFRSFFGIYPWLCRHCNSTFRLHNRGQHKRKSRNSRTTVEN